jgi:pimeloyl-ACP methyl ester carboxylesterase
MKKWFRRMYLGLLIFVVFIVVAVNVGMKFIRFSDDKAHEYFQEKDFDGIIEDIIINDKLVRVVSDRPQDSDSVLMVFVHGAPGSWDAFKDYVTDKDIYENTRIVAYDRPGYGGSDKKAMPGIQEQTEILKEIIKRFGLKRNILVGHSYGGPIAGMAALEGGTNVDAVIMIAPLIDPKSEPLFWYSYFSYWKLTSWLLPSEFVVAGSEKFAHSSELLKMKDEWKKAECSFIHVHGLKDGLAPGKENLAFSRNHIPEQNLETVVYDDRGHLIIWTEYKLMKNIILKTIDNLN